MRCCVTMLLGVALAAAGCAHSQQDPEAAAPISESDQVLARRLLRAARIPPAELPGRHLGALLAVAGAQPCPCEDSRLNLAECASDPEQSCVQAAFAVRAILRGLSRKESTQALSTRLMERFGPREPEVVDLAHAPCRGGGTAAVVLVVFSDFQCPFCSKAAKLNRMLEQAAGKRLRICFKHFPLKRIHPLAPLAARAAVAAQLQGKFWPMHDALFARPRSLEREDLLQRARDLGLDMELFSRDLDADSTRRQVEQDEAEARRLRLGGTPSFLVDGRPMTDHKTVEDFMDWIEEAEELRRQRKNEKMRGPASRPVPSS